MSFTDKNTDAEQRAAHDIAITDKTVSDDTNYENVTETNQPDGVGSDLVTELFVKVLEAIKNQDESTTDISTLNATTNTTNNVITIYHQAADPIVADSVREKIKTYIDVTPVACTSRYDEEKDSWKLNVSLLNTKATTTVTTTPTLYAALNESERQALNVAYHKHKIQVIDNKSRQLKEVLTGEVQESYAPKSMDEFPEPNKPHVIYDGSKKQQPPMDPNVLDTILFAPTPLHQGALRNKRGYALCQVVVPSCFFESAPQQNMPCEYIRIRGVVHTYEDALAFVQQIKSLERPHPAVRHCLLPIGVPIACTPLSFENISKHIAEWSVYEQDYLDRDDDDGDAGAGAGCSSIPLPEGMVQGQHPSSLFAKEAVAKEKENQDIKGEPTEQTEQTEQTHAITVDMEVDVGATTKNTDDDTKDIGSDANAPVNDSHFGKKVVYPATGKVLNMSDPEQVQMSAKRWHTIYNSTPSVVGGNTNESFLITYERENFLREEPKVYDTEFIKRLDALFAATENKKFYATTARAYMIIHGSAMEHEVDYKCEQIQNITNQHVGVYTAYKLRWLELPPRDMEIQDTKYHDPVLQGMFNSKFKSVHDLPIGIPVPLIQPDGSVRNVTASIDPDTNQKVLKVHKDEPVDKDIIKSMQYQAIDPEGYEEIVQKAQREQEIQRDDEGEGEQGETVKGETETGEGESTPNPKDTNNVAEIEIEQAENDNENDNEKEKYKGNKKYLAQQRARGKATNPNQPKKVYV